MKLFFDVVTAGATPPKTRNVGDYLKILNDLGKGDPKVISALRDLKDLHRNPLIHPDEVIESSEEAMALLGSILAVVTTMLKDIPTARKSKSSSRRKSK